MQIIEVNPRDCTKWKYADRSSFEYGDTNALALDIKSNGQIEPVSIRLIKEKDSEFKYEVIAGNRRFQACLANNIPMKAVIRDISDFEASIVQIKENDKAPLSDYSKGISFSKLKKDQNLTDEQLKQITGYSRTKVQRFLYFAKIDKAIWDAVTNMSKVSATSAETIYTLSKRGDEYKNALIEISDHIRKGAGCRRIEKLVDEIVLGQAKDNTKNENVITTSNGSIIAIWKKDRLEFSKSLNLDRKQFAVYIAKYFSKKQSVNKQIS